METIKVATHEMYRPIDKVFINEYKVNVRYPGILQSSKLIEMLERAVLTKAELAKSANRNAKDRAMKVFNKMTTDYKGKEDQFLTKIILNGESRRETILLMRAIFYDTEIEDLTDDYFFLFFTKAMDLIVNQYSKPDD